MTSIACGHCSSTRESHLFRELDRRSLRSAADTKVLPQPEPRTVGVHCIVPSVRGSDIAWLEWPDVWRVEHFLKLLDVVNNAFDVHLHTV